MKRADISVETLFGVLLFLVALAVLFFIFTQAQGESSKFLDLIPI